MFLEVSTSIPNTVFSERDLVKYNSINISVTVNLDLEKVYFYASLAVYNLLSNEK